MIPIGQDEQLVTDQIRQFARHSLGRYRETPEIEPGADDAGQWIRECLAMGLFDPEAGGLWQDDDPASRRQNVLTLMAISEQSPALALHLHLQALALRVMPAPGTGKQVERLPWLSFGLGPGFPAHQLANWQPGSGARINPAHLSDWWLPATAGSALLCAPDYWERLLVPAMTRKGAQWILIRRADISQIIRDSLQAPACWSAWRPVSIQQAKRRLIAPLSPDGYRNLLGQAWLGQLAIALASVRHAADLACTYADQRRQGGSVIGKHGAVQLLLAELDRAIHLTEPTLEKLCQVPASELWWQAARARGDLHPLLCRGVNAAMQVFGGIGYMRDTGVESLVRINQMLSCLHGTPMTMQQLHQQRRLAA